MCDVFWSFQDSVHVGRYLCSFVSSTLIFDAINAGASCARRVGVDIADHPWRVRNAHRIPLRPGLLANPPNSRPVARSCRRQHTWCQTNDWRSGVRA